MFKCIFFKINYFSRYGVIALIKVYQKTISLDHGVFSFLFPHGYCRFYPTCSNYGIEAVAEYGIIKGTIKTIWRILRCNPFNSGGYDPIKHLKK